MAPHTGRYSNDAADRRRTLAQWYCLLGGLALLIAGLGGFLSNASFSVGDVPSGTVEGDEFLGFEVNGWHNIVHVASGLLLLAAANTRPSAKMIALGFGLVYGLVALIGLIDGADVIGLLPVNGADNILHLALSALGVVAGIVSPARKGRRPRDGRRAATSGTRAGDGRSEREDAGAPDGDSIPGTTPRDH